MNEGVAESSLLAYRSAARAVPRALTQTAGKQGARGATEKATEVVRKKPDEDADVAQQFYK